MVEGQEGATIDGTDEIEGSGIEVPGPGSAGRRRAMPLDVVVGVFAVAWGVLANSGRLTDNSFLTHLATGRIILDTGGVPSSDPYSFTAEGTAWTVQSWIPSAVYAAAERVAGVAGLRAVGMVLGGVAAWFIWRLTRDCTSLLPRLAVVFGAMSICTPLWGLRPYMVGVIGLAIVWLVAHGTFAPPWVLAPLFWLWANSHGSFPLGIGLAVLLAIGTKLDGDSPATAARASGFAVLGTAAAVISPLGFSAVTFPVTALERADILRRIQEWQPADLTSLAERLYLLLVIAALLALIRRPSWRLGLPAVVFVVAGMLAVRNLAMATMVLVPVLAASVGDLGELRTTDRPRMAPVFAALGVLGVAIGGVSLLARPLDELKAYPDEAVALLGEGAKVVAPDYVGNLLEALDGTDAQVFVDDRVDMYPPEVLDDSSALVRGQPEWSSILDSYDADLVVWDRQAPVASLLAADREWQIWYADADWIVACRRGTCPS